MYYYIARHKDFTLTEFIFAQDLLSYILKESRLIKHISPPTPIPNRNSKNLPLTTDDELLHQ
jgi:hypothetical protein